MKKLLVIGIIILFIGLSISSTGTMVEQSTTGDVITVDDEGDGDYTSIKEALNNANPGDTIVIETENITLEGISYELGNGSDIGKPFIDGPGTDPYDLIAIKAEGVTINGFHIENYHGGGTGNVCIGIYHNANKCVIQNNDIANTLSSLIWVFSSDNMILDNNISHSIMRQGIVLREPCSNCIISGNVISDVETGILAWDSNHNTITGNKIMRCSDFGIDVAGSYNRIIRNHIENNDIGVQIWNFYNQVKRNNIINNNNHAQFIYGLPILQRLTNIWFGNYWDRPRLLPYPIPGAIILIPTIQFDWRPALLPYNIKV